MIKINDRFYISANSNEYTLQEKTKVQDKSSKNYGNEIFKDSGHYVTLENCLKGFLKTVTREYISKEELNSIKDLQKYIQEQNEFIKSLKLDI